MTIKEAKQQIKKTMQAYFSKDEFGNYNLEMSRQRPIFLMGPPGIGKTAIMQQVASELGVGLVSYSITHHTRQSALGLPFIVEKEFQGKAYHITEYTMSEIVASVYREIEDHGYKEGILFLDEMNCVSETLAPVMLQFLQYKVFGMHQIPNGWLVVTAGNPPEYNSSAREFDPVTWDRLKRIDIEPDLNAWKEYAKAQQIHPAVMTYLELHPEHFYSMEHTVDGNQFVTARGWEDLSIMLRLYEKNQIDVDDQLCGQYLQSERIAEDFSLYYELFQKYQSDYQVLQILSGEAPREIRQRAKDAPFDERVTLSGMLSEAICSKLNQVMLEEDSLLDVRDWLKNQKLQLQEAERQEQSLNDACTQRIDDEALGHMDKTKETGGEIFGKAICEVDLANSLKAKLAALLEELKKKTAGGRMSASAQKALRTKLHYYMHLDDVLQDFCRKSSGTEMSDSGFVSIQKQYFEILKNSFQNLVEQLKENAQIAGGNTDNALDFLYETCGNGTELLLILTDLTSDEKSSRFLAKYGSKRYTHYSDVLMVQERQARILEQVT